MSTLCLIAGSSLKCQCYLQFLDAMLNVFIITSLTRGSLKCQHYLQCVEEIEKGNIIFNFWMLFKTLI